MKAVGTPLATFPRWQPTRPARLVLIALTVLAALASGGFGFTTWRGRAASPEVTPAPAVREFTLVAEEIDWEIMPGLTVKAWAYNGQVPGPEIRVNEGDFVRITIQNRLPVGTSVHWHGMDVPPAMDGPAGLNQAPIEPGRTFTYEWVADPAGSRMYHSHTDVATQVSLGLYGPLVVEPKETTRPAYDREATYMLGEWDMEMTPDVATGKAPLGPRDSALRGGELGADLFLMNGKAHDAIAPLPIAEGERVLIRLMNMGNMPHPIHTHGHSFKIVATDGNPVPEGLELTKDTILIGPGERYDLELTGDNPGVWMFHCHIESHAANGMMTLIAYDGEVPTGPLGAIDPAQAPVTSGEPGTTSHGSHSLGSADTANVPPGAPSGPAAPTETAEPRVETVAAANEPADEVTVALRDDRFDGANVSVTAGTTVTWTNEGSHWHSVASLDGSFVSKTLAPGESFSVTLTEPGEIRYICKQHARQGMMATIIVT
ncbi:MAG: multicopper oxidase domain-containing protein [Chloroflexia bacterium]|nr:multicopper oxidase domain-containing protein [Chloroflexia bacterium]